MSQFSIDPVSGDLSRSAGAFERIDGLEEVRQHVATRLRLFQGECPMNTRLGMRFAAGGILDKGVPDSVREAEFREQILGTPGVVSVESVTQTLNTSTRVLSIEFAATVALDDLRRRVPLHDRVTVSLSA